MLDFPIDGHKHTHVPTMSQRIHTHIHTLVVFSSTAEIGQVPPPPPLSLDGTQGVWGSNQRGRSYRCTKYFIWVVWGQKEEFPSFKAVATPIPALALVFHQFVIFHIN